MTKKQLVEALKDIEWNQIEFKEARFAVPQSAYVAVSSFANTHGGWIVFGIKEDAGEYIVSGVAEADKVARDFLSSLKADNKVNHDIQLIEKKYCINGKHVLAFHIKEASHYNKPIYLNNDIRQSYIRKGGGSFKCTNLELERLLHDSTFDRWDGRIFNYPLEQAFDNIALKWYRTIFNNANPGYEVSQTDVEFLHQWGFLIRDNRTFIPTNASIILFGSPAALHQLLPRPILDVQWIPAKQDDSIPEIRWTDRYISETNIINTWREFVTKYLHNASIPFSIDSETLMRRDAPPEYRVFREATVNLLIHQNYADHSRKATVKFFSNCMSYWNPGDVFGDDSLLFEPGEKELRNPRIVSALRRIGLCDQAGTGIPMLKKVWLELTNSSPTIDNNRSNKSYELNLGFHNNSSFEPKSGSKSRSKSGSKSKIFEANNKSIITNKIVSYMDDSERSMSDISNHLGYNSISRVLKEAMHKLICDGIIVMTIPDKPKSSKQKYRLVKTPEKG